MIIVDGQPTKSTASKTLTQSWKTCLETCRKDATCVMIYKLSETKCQFFSFGGISSVKKLGDYSGKKVAFKRIISTTTCSKTNPLLSSTPTPEFRITGGQLYTTTLSFFSGSWKIVYSITKCPKDTKLFLRGSAAVCIGIYTFDGPLCNDYSQASSLCKAKTGTLTGPANSNEYDFILAESKKLYTSANPNGENYILFWIDGISRSAGNNYQFEDKTHNGSKNYKWTKASPGYTGPGYCLYTPNPVGLYIADYDCTVKRCCGGICWRGAVCQVKATVTNA